MKECPYIKQMPSYLEAEEIVNERIENGGASYWGIDDYRIAFESIYELSENTVQVPFGLEYYGEVRPFEAFGKKGVPAWWTFLCLLYGYGWVWVQGVPG